MYHCLPSFPICPPALGVRLSPLSWAPSASGKPRPLRVDGHGGHGGTRSGCWPRSSGTGSAPPASRADAPIQPARTELSQTAPQLALTLERGSCILCSRKGGCESSMSNPLGLLNLQPRPPALETGFGEFSPAARRQQPRAAARSLPGSLRKAGEEAAAALENLKGLWEN